MGIQLAFAAVFALAGLGACAESRDDASLANNKDRETNTNMTQSEPPEADGERRNLPFAHGRSFASLDEYLAHLRDRAGPVGQPWYREIRPGVYEQVTTRVPAGTPEIVTREELMRRFGFTR